jgi:hypothetical protein
MLTAYLDESQHTGPGHAVVAGFWGTEDQWNAVADDWKLGLGGRKALHMSGLRWNSPSASRRVKPLLARLGPIPHTHNLHPVYGAVKVTDYINLIANEPEFEKKMCGYILCLSIVFSVLAKHLPGHAKLKIVCEQQSEYEPLARALFDSFSKMVGRNPKCAYFSDIGFIPKDSSPLTQPGDFLAFAKGKYLDERGSRKDLWSRPILGSAGPDGIPGRVHSRENARRLVKQIKSGTQARQASGIFI